MGLKEQIEQDIKQAMLAKAVDKLSCLRMLKSALQNARIATQQDLSDGEVITVIQKEVKKRKEASALYAQAGQSGLQKKEEQDLVWLEPYLPAVMSEVELTGLAEKAKAQIMAEGGVPNLGSMMKILVPQVQGRADGAIIKAVVLKTIV